MFECEDSDPEPDCHCRISHRLPGRDAPSGSFSEGLGAFSSFTLEKYVKSYTDPALAEVIINTIVFHPRFGPGRHRPVAVHGLPEHEDQYPVQTSLQIIPIVPMMIPHILFAVSWVLLLNPSNGLINLVLKEILHLQDSPFNIYTLVGMILVEGLLDLPIAYLTIARRHVLF